MSIRNLLAAFAVLTTTGLAACETVPPAQSIGPSDPIWREEFRGINLTPAQVEQIRALKLRLDQEAFGQGFDLGDFLAMARRPTGDAEFDRGPMAAAIRRYNEGVRRVLTPEQYAVYRSNGGG